MRIGIFGGSFDPVHNGHLLLAETARDVCSLDEVWFVPAPSPPHKQGRSLLPIRERMEMLEFATAGIPEFVVQDLESRREGPSYTVDTLRELKQDDGSRELVFLMGADSLSDLPTWREPEQIAQLSTIAAINRGFNDAIVPDSLSEAVRDRIRLIEMPPCGFSSTDIRERVRNGRSIRFQLPRAIERLIYERGWYVQGTSGVRS